MCIPLSYSPLHFHPLILIPPLCHTLPSAIPSYHTSLLPHPPFYHTLPSTTPSPLPHPPLYHTFPSATPSLLTTPSFFHTFSTATPSFYHTFPSTTPSLSYLLYCHTLPFVIPSLLFFHSSVQYASNESSLPHTKEPTSKTQATKEMVSECVSLPLPPGAPPT